MSYYHPNLTEEVYNSKYKTILFKCNWWLRDNIASNPYGRSRGVPPYR